MFHPQAALVRDCLRRRQHVHEAQDDRECKHCDSVLSPPSANPIIAAFLCRTDWFACGSAQTQLP
jgi:hypothetical protein